MQTAFLFEFLEAILPWKHELRQLHNKLLSAACQEGELMSGHPLLMCTLLVLQVSFSNIVPSSGKWTLWALNTQTNRQHSMCIGMVMHGCFRHEEPCLSLLSYRVLLD